MTAHLFQTEREARRALAALKRTVKVNWRVFDIPGSNQILASAEIDRTGVTGKIHFMGRWTPVSKNRYWMRYEGGPAENFQFKKQAVLAFAKRARKQFRIEGTRAHGTIHKGPAEDGELRYLLSVGKSGGVHADRT